MSDNSTSAPEGPQPDPPATPFAPAPPAASYPEASAYPQAPTYPGAAAAPQPTQAYPGAAPTFSAPPQPYGAITPQQPYGAVAQQPYSTPAAVAPVSGYPVYGAPVYPAPRPASGLAITSLICGIAGVLLFWIVVPLIASIVAVITGHMALRQTKENPAIGGRGMAFAGLIMGYIMVGFLVVGILITVISFIFVGAFTLPFVMSS